MDSSGLQKILEKHKLWLDNKGRVGERAYFDGVDLSKNDLSSNNLEGVFFRGANLREANLAEARLTRSDFRRTNLAGADLAGAILNDTNFGWANLTNANLQGVTLIEAAMLDANFTGTDLSGAELSRSFLYRACFVGTDLKKAKLREARLAQNVFAALDLSEVIGLNEVIHHGPSTIGMDTVRMSKGNIPDVFLKGCGLSDWEIELVKLYKNDLDSGKVNDILYRIPSLRIANPIQYYSCFISYSDTDKSFANKLLDELQKHGIRCWLDEKQILPGDILDNEIDRGIRLWDKFLLCCSKNSLTSWWVDNEINKALEKERRIMKKTGQKALALIPLDLDGYLFTDAWQSGMKSEVTRRKAPCFTNWEGNEHIFQRQIQLVIKSLRADEAARERPPRPLL